MPRTWRLVDSGLVPPPRSAALDEAILEARVRGDAPQTLHFYGRTVPTVSVGYFQKVSETVDLEECRRRGVAIVRRKSGGSCIYTDSGQIIYGLVVDCEDLPRGGSAFNLICGAIAKAISSFGVEARYRPPNDIEVRGRKISGNAQLMRKGYLLQHGTVLVDTDVLTMDAVLKVARSGYLLGVMPSERVTTLAAALGRAPDLRSVKQRIVKELEGALGVRFSEGALTRVEEETVARLVEQRYSRDDWNLRL